MSGKMDLIIFGQTNHILAAAVSQQDEDGAGDANNWVGDALWLRDPVSGETMVRVPVDHLQVKTVDRREDVMMTPRHFLLVDNLPEYKAESITSLQLDGTIATVTLPSNVAENTSVWLLIEGGPAPIVHKVEIPENANTANEPLILQAGNYRALMLAPGYRPLVVPAVVP